MRVSGILETALYVADPDVTAAFYRRLFGFANVLVIIGATGCESAAAGASP
jgi:hypothetical protein